MSLPKAALSFHLTSANLLALWDALRLPKFHHRGRTQWGRRRHDHWAQPDLTTTPRNYALHTSHLLLFYTLILKYSWEQDLRALRDAFPTRRPFPPCPLQVSEALYAQFSQLWPPLCSKGHSLVSTASFTWLKKRKGAKTSPWNTSTRSRRRASN